MAESLVEKANNLSSDVLSSGLLVVHDTRRGGEDDVAELTRREQLHHPLLQVRQSDVVTGRDHTRLVQTVRDVLAECLRNKAPQQASLVLHIPAVQLNHDLAGSVGVDLLELANVACERRLVSECCERLNVENHGKVRKRVRSSPVFDLSAT